MVDIIAEPTINTKSPSRISFLLWETIMGVRRKPRAVPACPAKTVAEQTFDWFSALNHSDARRAGTIRTNTCEMAIIVWPRNAIRNWLELIEKTLTQAPRAVPIEPIMAEYRSSWKGKFCK